MRELIECLAKSRISVIGYTSSSEKYINKILDHISNSEIVDINDLISNCSTMNLISDKKFLISNLMDLKKFPDSITRHKILAHSLRIIGSRIRNSEIPNVIFLSPIYPNVNGNQSFSGGNSIMYQCDFALALTDRISVTKSRCSNLHGREYDYNLLRDLTIEKILD